MARGQQAEHVWHSATYIEHVTPMLQVTSSAYHIVIRGILMGTCIDMSCMKVCCTNCCHLRHLTLKNSARNISAIGMSFTVEDDVLFMPAKYNIRENLTSFQGPGSIQAGQV